MKNGKPYRYGVSPVRELFVELERYDEVWSHLRELRLHYVETSATADNDRRNEKGE